MKDAALFLLTLSGFTLLLSAMTRHHQDWRGCKPSPGAQLGLRLAGFVILGMALILAGATFGWAYGAVAWTGWLSASAAIVVGINLNRERIQRRLEGKRK